MASKSSNIYSVNSADLNDEMLAIKRTNERFAYGVGILSQLMWALNTIQIKTFQPNFPGTFSNNSFVFWRSIAICFLGYCFCKYKKIKIKPIKEIKHKFWFFMRSIGNYFSLFLWISTLSYFRVSTTQVINSCFPIIVIFLSIFILHETFYLRYIIGIFICIISSAMILKNERTSEARKTAINNNTLVGALFALGNLSIDGFLSFAQKIMVKDHLSPDEQNFYLGFFNALPSFICCCFNLHFGINIIYILYAFSNGFFMFYTANALQTKALEYIAISKFMPLTYMTTFFIFLFGVIILKEPLFFSDLIGAFLIIGFQVYNIYFPPGRKISDINKEETNINTKESFSIVEQVDEKLIE